MVRLPKSGDQVWFGTQEVRQGSPADCSENVFSLGSCPHPKHPRIDAIQSSFAFPRFQPALLTIFCGFPFRQPKAGWQNQCCPALGLRRGTLSQKAVSFLELVPALFIGLGNFEEHRKAPYKGLLGRKVVCGQRRTQKRCKWKAFDSPSVPQHRCRGEIRRATRDEPADAICSTIIIWVWVNILNHQDMDRRVFVHVSTYQVSGFGRA